MEDARKQRDGRGGAPSGATSDSRDMSSEEIRAMLVAVRIEAHAAARVARRAAAAAAARAPRVPYVSKAAAEADARAQRRRAAVVLQAACRGHLARGVAMRRRERWTIAVRCAEQRLGRSVLTQWRAACTRTIARRAAKRKREARAQRRKAAIRIQAAWRGNRVRRREAQGRRREAMHAVIEARLQARRKAVAAREREEAEQRAACEETRRVIAEGEARRAAAALVRRLTARRARAATARERMAKRAIAEAAVALAVQEEERRRATTRLQIWWKGVHARLKAARRDAEAVEMRIQRQVDAAAMPASQTEVASKEVASKEVATQAGSGLVAVEVVSQTGESTTATAEAQTEQPVQTAAAAANVGAGTQTDGEQGEAAWRVEAASWMARVEERLLASMRVETQGLPVGGRAELPWPRRSGGRQRRVLRARRRGECWAIDYEQAERRAELRAEQRFGRAAAARGITVSKCK